MPIGFCYRILSGDPWTEIPSEAMMGTGEGGIILEPNETFRNGVGEQVYGASYGRAVLRSSFMTACGMSFWNNLINTYGEQGLSACWNTFAPSASIYLSVFDPRASSGSGEWIACSGFLNRPIYTRVRPGEAHTTYFYSVEITVDRLQIL